MAVAITRTADVAGVSSLLGVCTLSGVSIGTASADRVIVLLSGNEDATAATPSSATIDYGSGDISMSATALAQQGNVSARAFYLAVPTGTTATFKVSVSGTLGGTESHYAVYAITGANSTPTAVGTNNSTNMNATPLTTGSITVATNGGFVAVAAGAAAFGKTWTNATEDIDTAPSAWEFTTATRTTSGTVTITCAGGTFGEDGALAYILFAPALVNYTIAAAAGAYSIGGTAATLKAQRKDVAGVGSYSISGTNATLLHKFLIPAGSASYAMAGTAAALTKGSLRSLQMDAGAYTISGSSASQLVTRRLAAGSGTYTLAGSAATLRKGYSVVSGSGSYVLSGTAATLRRTRKLSAAAGAYAITGTAARLGTLLRLPANGGDYLISGADALLYSLTTPPPSGRLSLSRWHGRVRSGVWRGR